MFKTNRSRPPTGLRNYYLEQLENKIQRAITGSRLLSLLFLAVGSLINSMPSAYGQAFHAAPVNLAPIQLAEAEGPVLPSLTPTDITPVNIGRERELLKPGYTYYLFQKLPSHLWFNVSAETSQRYEANVFYSKSNYVSDYVYRILPNISLGYETYKKINVYCNYFTIKDIFVGHRQLTFPTTQSLALGVRRDFTLSPRTNFQVDFQSRELWQSVGLRQADLLPGITLTRFVSPKAVVYFNSILQLRGANYFVAPTREIDPFYTIGALYTQGSWMYSAVGTLVTNFRHPPFNDAIPPVSNNSIIVDFEISHPVPKLPALATFIRAEPIFNWNSHGLQGISGFDFRLFGGIRLTVAKPAYQSSMQTLKQQLKELNLGPAGGPPKIPSEEQPAAPGAMPQEGPANGPSAPPEVPQTTPPENPPAENAPQPPAGGAPVGRSNDGINNSDTIEVSNVPYFRAKAEIKPQIKPEPISKLEPETEPDLKPEIKLAVNSDIKPKIESPIKPELSPPIKPEVPDQSPAFIWTDIQAAQRPAEAPTEVQPEDPYRQLDQASITSWTDLQAADCSDPKPEKPAVSVGWIDLQTAF